MRGRIAAFGLATMMLVTACSSNAAPTPNPQVAFCSSISALASAIKSFKQLDAQDTISDIQTTGEAVKTAFAAFKDAAGTLAKDQVAGIQTAADNLQAAVGAIPASDTVDQALESLKPQVEALEAARFEAGKAQCGEVAAQQAEAEKSAEPAASAPAVAASPAAS